MVKWIIAGLGNPGELYQDSRRNIGFMVADEMAFRAKVKIHNQSLFAITVRSKGILYAKPSTSMNESGLSISVLGFDSKIPTEKIIVIHDDINLSFGDVQISRGGPSNGHEGIASCIAVLCTEDFYRVSVGVGPLPSDVSRIAYLMEEFGEAENAALANVIYKAADMTETIMEPGKVQA